MYSFPYHRLCMYIKSFDGKKVKISAIFSFSPFKNSVHLHVTRSTCVCTCYSLVSFTNWKPSSEQIEKNVGVTNFISVLLILMGFFSCQIKKVINFYTSKSYNTQERVIWLHTTYYVFKLQIVRCVKESVYLSNKFLWCFA